MDERLARRVPLARAAAADALGQDRGEQPPERALDVADELDLGLVVGVDLGRLRVDVDDPLASVRVPARRRVLDQVVADRDDEVGAVEAGQDVVAGLQPDGHQREVAPVVDRALAHERHRDRDVEALGEGPQLGRGVPAQDAVAGQDERPAGGDEEPGGVLDRLVGRLGEVGLVRLDRAEVVGDRRRRQVLRAARCGSGPASRAGRPGTPCARSPGRRPPARRAGSTSSPARTCARCRRTGATPCAACRARSGR